MAHRQGMQVARNENRLILVTGASGRTGRQCIAKLVDEGANIRAFVRRPEAGDELRRNGVSEIATGDLFSQSDLDAAMRGVWRVLHICPPTHPQEAELARAVTDLSLRHGVDRLVLYSVLHPTVKVPHHQLKLAAEGYLKDTGLRYTILQPCRYMTHLLPIWPEVVRTGIHSMPFSVESQFSLVDLGDLAEAAARVLMEDNHEYATYELAGPERLSQVDCARIISDVLGRPVRAERKPQDVFLKQMVAAGMPQQRIDVLLTMNKHYDAHGLLGNSNVLRWLLGREPRRFKAFVETLPQTS